MVPFKTHSSIDEAEVARFSAMAAEWWDPNGKFKPLHRFNPVRLAFIRDEAASVSDATSPRGAHSRACVFWTSDAAGAFCASP